MVAMHCFQFVIKEIGNTFSTQKKNQYGTVKPAHCNHLLINCILFLAHMLCCKLFVSAQSDYLHSDPFGQGYSIFRGDGEGD